MDKSRLLLICIILCCFMANFCFIVPKFESTKVSCWKNPSCKCYGGNRTIIDCTEVQNISDVIDLFRSRTPVYKIRLRGKFTTIPSKAFENISVSVMWITAPLQSNIPNDSLLGILNLKILILNRTEYQTIPEVFSNQYYTEFESSEGRLVTIETQLQNMSSAVEIRLNRNWITSISEEAFYGTDNVHRIDLSYNHLIYIHPKTLEPLTFLEAIYLQHNHLQMLDGCFHGLNPVIVDLYGNNLTNIDDVLHNGMWNLKYLNIGGNPKMTVSSSSFSKGLKSLSELHMSHNEYTKLDRYLLEKLWNLHKLYLNGNNLTFIPRYFFRHNPFLSVLELSDNQLTSIGEDVMSDPEYWKNWLRIRLDGNRLERIDLGNKPAKILSLDISRNRLNHLKETDLVVLQKVKYLNLSYNEITSLENGSFRNFHSLKDLDLSHNHLKHLNYSLQGLKNMNKLRLSSISLELLFEDDFLDVNRLKGLYIRNNSLQSVSGTFTRLKYLGILDLALNNLTTLTTDSFPYSWNTSMRLTVLWMAGNPWTCDCRLAWMDSWAKVRGAKLKDEPVCAAPEHLKGRTLRSLNLTDYERWYQDCPDICECNCGWDGNQIYTVTHCIRRELNDIPKVLPINLRMLDLSWNNIEIFDSKDILRFGNLEQLNLEHNNIHKVVISVFPSKMSSLRLAYNQLHKFPLDEWFAANASLSQMSLSHNPWTCDCDAWHFRNWILQENETIVDADEIRCGKEESSYLRNKLITSLTQKRLCSYLSDIVILSICSALLLSSVLLVFCYRHSLIALFYTSGCTCLKGPEGHEYPYDIFLMYCEDDEQFALGELATALESPKYSFNVCIPTRDISAPRTQQKINSYLPLCTKVLVLLTRSFVENRECMRFLVSAMSFSTESSSECIIFVTNGELPPGQELDPILRTLLRSCTRLRWGQCLFWQKLVYQLPKKAKKQQEWGDVEEEEALLRS